MIIPISSIDNPALAPYSRLTESELRREETSGIVIVESPKVIETALQSGLEPLSLLCERKHIEGDAASIISRYPRMPVYTAERQLLASLTGYTLTRGVLCAMRRPQLPTTDTILDNAGRVCVIYDVCDTTNIGAIFRSAAAIGFDCIVLSPRSCDPFNRRSIRVSMGTVFRIPWCYESDILTALKNHEITSISMALTDRSVYLQDFTVQPSCRYGLILGSEGYGLPDDIIARSAHTVKIPMHRGIDSLNVGAAAAIALWHFARK